MLFCIVARCTSIREVATGLELCQGKLNQIDLKKIHQEAPLATETKNEPVKLSAHCIKTYNRNTSILSPIAVWSQVLPASYILDSSTIALFKAIYYTRQGYLENRNGVIWMFFPKKIDFNLISKFEVKRVEKELNTRPQRKFGYLSPNEVFSRFNGSVALMGWPQRIIKRKLLEIPINHPLSRPRWHCWFPFWWCSSPSCCCISIGVCSRALFGFRPPFFWSHSCIWHITLFSQANPFGGRLFFSTIPVPSSTCWVHLYSFTSAALFPTNTASAWKTAGISSPFSSSWSR